MSKVLHLTVLVGAVLLAAFVLMPSQGADAAAPNPADDPLALGYFLRPVSMVMYHPAPLKENTDKTLLLKKWTYTQSGSDDPYNSD